VALPAKGGTPPPGISLPLGSSLHESSPVAVCTRVDPQAGYNCFSRSYLHAILGASTWRCWRFTVVAFSAKGGTPFSTLLIIIQPTPHQLSIGLTFVCFRFRYGAVWAVYCYGLLSLRGNRRDASLRAKDSKRRLWAHHQPHGFFCNVSFRSSSLLRWRYPYFYICIYVYIYIYIYINI